MSIPVMISEPNKKPGDTLKSFVSTSMCLFEFTSGRSKLRMIIMKMINPNVIDMRSRKG